MGKAYGHRKESKNDNLQTPYSMTEQLFENESFDFNKNVCECAMGEGAIVKILFKYFSRGNVLGNDLQKGYNFLEEKNKYNTIITNPPFSKFNDFVQKAKEVAIEKFAFLGKLDFLSGLARYQKGTYLDINYPLTKVYIFIRKPDLREWREDGKYKTGIDAYCWYIWERNKFIDEKTLNVTYKKFRPDYPIIKWIDNQKYVLKQDKKK